MQSRERSIPDRIGSGVRVLAGQLESALLQGRAPASAAASAPRAGAASLKEDVPLDFHRRMFAIIMAVQESVWAKGVQQLLGYATDYGLGQARGVQTLVLKTRGRSAYVRLQWETIMSDAEESRRQVADAVQAAIGELT